ncbi:unnamed protein product [Protopolystoma xenopodis]|uniref:Uncharacterized protein n=1 Tax=Protopolystoma xenopodis TaxID=117903 RepID=A0A3S4ZLL0_9PLAT|nr:unnamed protein product [Protopolystoma xenopodis]
MNTYLHPLDASQDPYKSDPHCRDSENGTMGKMLVGSRDCRPEHNAGEDDAREERDRLSFIESISCAECTASLASGSRVSPSGSLASCSLSHQSGVAATVSSLGLTEPTGESELLQFCVCSLPDVLSELATTNTTLVYSATARLKHPSAPLSSPFRLPPPVTFPPEVKATDHSSHPMAAGRHEDVLLMLMPDGSFNADGELSITEWPVNAINWTRQAEEAAQAEMNDKFGKFDIPPRPHER